MSEKGFYLDKPLQLADRVERLGYYLNEEAAALIRKQYAEIEALRAERDALRVERNAVLADCGTLLEALRQIDGFTISQFATAGDMAARCVDVAKVALYTTRKEDKT